MGKTVISQLLVNQSLLSLSEENSLFTFSFSNNITIHTASAWRLSNNQKLLITSQDHHQIFGHSTPIAADQQAFQLLKNQSIQTVQLNNSTGDLTLTFSQELDLDFLQLSTGFEAYSLNSPNHEIICQGSGELIIVQSP